VAGASTASAAAALLAATCAACTTVDPGPNFVVPEEQFDPDYFFCHVEPEVLFAHKCGSGDQAAGDPANGCHFNSSAVSGMALVAHDPIDCGGGDHPVDRARVGAGSPAQGNLQAASLEMSRDYLTAPILVRPGGSSHPQRGGRAILPQGDPAIDVIKAWASK
jgi:hypothetical protein